MLAQAIGDYRYSNSNSLSPIDDQQLNTLQWSILNYGEEILALSASLVLTDILESLTRMSSITAEIKDNIKTLNNIQKIINVATCIVKLGVAIVEKTPRLLLLQ